MGVKIDRLNGRKTIPLSLQIGQRTRQARRLVGNEGTATDTHAGEERKQLWIDIAAGRREQGGVKLVPAATQFAYCGQHLPVPGVGIVELFQINAQGGCGQLSLFDGHDRGDLFGQDGGAGADSGPQVEKMFEGIQFEHVGCHDSQDFSCQQVAVLSAAAKRRICSELMPRHLQAVTPVAYEQLQRRLISLVEEEDVHRQVELQAGWIFVFAVQNQYALGCFAQRIGSTAYSERHALGSGGPGSRRKVITFSSLFAATTVTQSCEKFSQLRVVEKTGVNGHRIVVPACKGKFLGVSPIKLHTRAEGEIEHGRRAIRHIGGACANGYNVRHQLFGDLPALRACIALACFAGQDIDNYLPLQG